MPFYIYRFTQERRNSLHFCRHASRTLAGKDGLIIKAAKTRGFLNRDNYGWRLSAQQMLSEDGHDHDTRIISDVTPRRSDEVNLMSIEFVSGYSYANGNWAPLLFHMVHVAGDLKVGKREFSYVNRPSEIIRTFVYIRRPDNNSAWNWGRTGGVNGPLLWPPAIKFFEKEIEQVGSKTTIPI